MKLKNTFLIMRLLIVLLSITMSVTSYAQEHIVTGVVRSANEEAVIGASVIEKGTHNGTATNVQGKFSLRVSNPNTILEISSVGYVKQSVSVKKRKKIQVMLEEDANLLDELVVVGYGNLKKSDLTGSMNSLKNEDITDVKSGSFLESMQGKVAGVMISSASGEPGAGVNISIRGANSINAGTQPLYVIDGMQVDVNSSEIASGSSYGNNTTYNPLASINQDDIESIEILKDASAAAIYGSRGANGVIIVTTKSGNKSSKSKVALNMYWGISTVTKTIEMLEGQEFLDYIFKRSPTSWGIDTDGDGEKDMPFSAEGLPSHNWQDEIYRTAITQSYSVSFDGGNSKTNFSSSLGYLNQEGVVLGNDFKRYNARVKVNHNATKRIQLGSNINISYQESEGITSSGGNGQFWGILQSIIMFRPVNPKNLEDLPIDDPHNAGMSNPMAFINDAEKSTTFLNVMADAFVDVKLTKYLNFHSQVNGKVTSSEDKAWYPITTSWGYNTNGKNFNGSANSISWQNSNTLTWNRVFQKKHSFNVMLGAECSGYDIKTKNFTVENFPFDGDMSDMPDMGTTMPAMPNYNHNKSTRASLFGRVNYVFNNRYLFTTTLRRDGSSKFGANNKYAYFPSAAFAWRISEENFMKNIDFISNLKLRLSYGVTGNDRIPYYQSLSRTDVANASNETGKQLGLALSSLPNPDLKWETTQQYNIGLDLGLLKNRISLTADFYYKRTDDMLLNADVPSQIGTFKQWKNIGSVDNRGFEVALSTTNIKTRDFSWRTDINFNMNKNKVRSLGGVSFIPVTAKGTTMKNAGRVIEGHPIGTAYGYIMEGVYQKDDFDENGNLKSGVTAISGRTVKPGWLKYKDLSGDGIVDAEHDQTIISHSAPKHFGGMNNRFHYKDFDFSFFFQWSYGNEVLNLAKLKMEGFTNNNNVTKDFYHNRWTEENPTNYRPAIGDSNAATDCSTYYVEDASYLRLKNVTLGYNVPSKWLKKNRISRIRLYVSADNLLTFTNYSGSDPEVSYNDPLLTGLDNQVYPRSKTFNLGINLQF